MGIEDLGTRDKRQVGACREYCAIAMRQWRRGRGDGEYLNYPGIQETTGCLNIFIFFFSPGTPSVNGKKRMESRDYRTSGHRLVSNGGDLFRNQGCWERKKIKTEIVRKHWKAGEKKKKTNEQLLACRIDSKY